MTWFQNHKPDPKLHGSPFVPVPNFSLYVTKNRFAMPIWTWGTWCYIKMKAKCCVMATQQTCSLTEVTHLGIQVPDGLWTVSTRRIRILDMVQTIYVKVWNMSLLKLHKNCNLYFELIACFCYLFFLLHVNSSHCTWHEKNCLALSVNASVCLFVHVNFNATSPTMICD